MAKSFNGTSLDESNAIGVRKFSPIWDRGVSRHEVPVGIGARIGRQTRGGRRFRLEGDARGANANALQIKLAELEDAFDVTEPSSLILQSGREIFCVPSSRFESNYVPGSELTVVRWKIDLFAEWPFWTSTTPTTTVVAHTSGTQTLYTMTNNGNVEARWTAELTTAATASDEYIELTNSTTGEILRISGFSLGTSETLIIDGINGQVFQGTNAYPDSSFGVEAIDGKFWRAADGVNNCVLDTSHSNWTLTIEFYDTYRAG